MAPTQRTQPSKKKKLAGGIVKETNNKLTAIEKRRRMLEAGRKFTKFNGVPVHSYSKEQLMGLVDGCKATFSSIPVPTTQPKTISTNSGVSDSRNCTQNADGKEIKQVKKSFAAWRPPPTAALRPSQSTSKKNSSAAGKVDSVGIPFEKDAKSLFDIINHKPIAHIIGRPSYARQRERLSLFPNGINPMDITVKSHTTAATFLSPRISTSIFDSSEPQPLSTPIGASSSCTPSNSTLRSSCKKTPKSVRFNDKIAFRSPSVASVEKPQVDSVCEMINVGVDDEELDAQLCKLSLKTIMRLQNSLRRIKSEAGGNELNENDEGNAEQLLAMNSYAPKRGTRSRKMADEGSTRSEKKLSTVNEEDESSSRITRMKTRSAGHQVSFLPPKSPQRNRRTRKVLAEVYAD